jgi:hypothetical protein
LRGFGIGAVFRERAYGGDRSGALALLNAMRTELPREGEPNTIGSWAFLASAVEGLAILGEPEQAAAWYPVIRGLLDTGTICMPWLARFPQTVAGIAACAARRWNSAEEHFRVALHQAEELPDHFEQAECRRFYAAMLLDRGDAGDRVNARALLSQALHDYTRIGMPRHVEIATRLLASADA